MKKTPILAALVLSAGILAPAVGQAAGTLAQINQKIAQLQQQQQNAQSKISAVNEKLSSIREQKGQLQKDIEEIDRKLNDTQERIQELDRQVDTTTIKAQDAAVQLDKAEKRVKDRDELLKKRVKVMYEMGDVSYLDVLLGAKDFGDFLNRLGAVQMIVNQDFKILEENTKDKQLIEKKKKEVDTELANLQNLYAQAAELKAGLKAQQKERTVVMAALTKQEGDLEEVKQSEQSAMLDLMDNMKAAMKEKKRLLTPPPSKSSRSTGGGVYSGGLLAWPLPDSHRITSGFGYRSDPFTGQSTGHDGFDIGAPQGTEIDAAADGVVLVAGYVRGYGNCIIIDHGGDLSTLYGHIRPGGLFVKAGEQVKRGEKIAEVGSTGRSTGPHLHFGVYKGRAAVNPGSYLK